MKPIRLFLLLFLAFFYFENSTAQTVNSKLAEALQHTLDSMHQVLNIKGLGASLQFSNDAVWAGGSGISSISPLDSIGPEHAFAVASTTKTITAACILQLVDEGVLTLNDSLHHWLPTFNFINPNITIHQLLRHQSGVYDVLLNPSFQPQMSANVNQIWTLEQIISTFVQAPVFQPGANWGYSNTNYLLLGMIIESATGNPYWQEFETRFFNPLGLDSFSQPAFNPLPTEVAHLWLDITGDGIVDDSHYLFSTWNSFFSGVGPAGAYFATPSDMARWMRACMSGSLYYPATWELAQQTISTGLPGNTKYGLGLMERQYLGFKGLGHGGDISYSSSVIYFPEKDLSIAVHANDANINSWALSSTVIALLQVYLDCEAAITDISKVSLPDVTTLVYPNPFTDKLTVSIDLHGGFGEVNMTMTDMLGRTVGLSFSQNDSFGKQEIVLENLESLNSGVYFLNTFLDGKPLKTDQIIKVNE
ncbi:MAG TPA: serine hydrolase [Saprospiraceae bacterium]|nr:serine hydrolase [Saprospiraceae bacterium]HMQ85607.1 serine hydrolase [Saprospiraceae bacterium]